MANIKLARYRNTPYIVNFETNGGMKSYSWAGSKGKKYDVKDVPEEVVDWLTMNSVCFNDGELAIVGDTKKAKELVSNIDNVEEYENNTHSKEEAIKILESHTNSMKAELNKITNRDEKKFFIETAKEIELDSNTKLTFLAEWFGVKKDILFGE